METGFVTVEVDGAKYPVSFNATAMEHVEIYVGRPIGDVLTSFDGNISLNITLGWIGLVHGYRLSGEKEKSEALTRLDFSDKFHIMQINTFLSVLPKFLPNPEKDAGQKKTIQKAAKNR